MSGWTKSWPPDLPPIYCKTLRKRVFTHQSLSKVNNERLEFLGDSVLGMAVAELLHLNYDNLTSGDMTRVRSKLVCNAQLAEWAYTLYSLHEQLSIGRVRPSKRPKSKHRNKGDKDKNKNKNKLQLPKYVADLFEAYIGAVYLESGFNIVREWLHVLIEPLMVDMVGVPDTPNSPHAGVDFCRLIRDEYECKDGGLVQYTMVPERQVLRCHTDVLVLSEIPNVPSLTDKSQQRAAMEALKRHGVIHELQIKRQLKKRPWSIISKTQRGQFQSQAPSRPKYTIVIDSDEEYIGQTDNEEVVDLTDDNNTITPNGTIVIDSDSDTFIESPPRKRRRN